MLKTPPYNINVSDLNPSKILYTLKMISINTMTKDGYTHIIVHEELHAILKR